MSENCTAKCPECGESPHSDVRRLEAEVAELSGALRNMTAKRNILARAVSDWADSEGDMLEREADVEQREITLTKEEDADDE